MTLFSDPCGPRIYYAIETLSIDDLNPEQHLCWHLSRWEMFKLGVKAIVAASLYDEQRK